MPPVTTVFTPVATTVASPGGTPTSTSPQPPVATINQLHTELAAIGLPVGGAEAGAAPQFGAATSAQLKVFQGRYNLPVDGNLTPETGGILTLAALAATESDRPKLRTEVKNAVNAVPNSPQYNYWLARYALMAGDYGVAARVSPRLIDLSGAKVDLGSAVFTDGSGNPQPQQPNVTFPENFYSYRYSLMAQADIDALRQVATTMPPAPATPPAPLTPATNASRRSIALRPANGTPDTFDPPHRPVIYDPPQATPTGASRQQRLIDSALAWLGAIEAWQFGNAEFARQRYASAIDAHDRCQNYILSYFSIYPDYDIQFTTNTLDARVDELIWTLVSSSQNWADIWSQVNWRRSLLSLMELSQFDWQQITSGNIVYQLLQGNLAGSDQPPPPTNAIGPEHRKILMDTHLVVIAAVLVPLARGEANRLRRQYSAALDDFSRVLRTEVPVPNSTPPQMVPVSLKCEFIEVPFTRLLLAETMLDEAETQYKSRSSVDDETDATRKADELSKLGLLAQEFNTRQIPGDVTGNTASPFQHLVAALTYARVFEVVGAEGDYVANTKQALNTLQGMVTSTVASGDASSMSFRSIGQTITIPNVNPIGNVLPGLTSGTHPHECYLQFNVPAGQTTGWSNPRVYALLLQTQSRLLQIWNGFNYLGYRDNYVPPWRFSYLLDRARYFSEHAKNAQRDYLNFLNNAENEEYKEMSASQNVELEKVNVQIETARVDQAAKEVHASDESVNLAVRNANDAQQRADAYRKFSQYADSLFDTRSGGNPILENDVHGFMSRYYPGFDTIGTDVGDAFSAGAVSKRHEALLAHAQRDVELINLHLAVEEAAQAAVVARAQREVAKAGLVVAGLQRQAALLRHEFALQNLQFMRNQILNTEQWYRMAGAIRSVGDTYLRYAIQMAFLAQQAYNFEADKRLNIIRFDYDLSDVGAMLAADFLLRDLDTLEQDLVVGQQTRLQQLRYVLSLAREFPETLTTLAGMGEVMFSMRLEQLERHFPGIVNMRISNIDLLPVALMDPTRVSVELTHLGTGMVRLKSQPGNSPLNGTDLATSGDWLPNAAAVWPVKVHVSGPETDIFSGLTRQDAASVSAITANERGAFEGLPAASSWKIDMSMQENQVVPGTLADVLITFTISGYYDPALKDAVTNAAAAPRQLATTTIISARRVLPDAYYSLAHTGTLNWNISRDMLNIGGIPGALRNLAVVLPPVQDGLELGRCYCRYPVAITVSAGSYVVATLLPQFTLAPNGLALTCAYTGAADVNVTWDFGDNTPLAQGASAQHVYARPGRYEVLTQLSKGSVLAEYRSAVVVSTNHAVVAPLIVVPTFSIGTTLAPDGTIPLTVAPLAGITNISLDCSAGNVRAFGDSGAATLNLKPGSYLIDFLARRRLSARFYSKQRFLPTAPVTLYRERISTNRTFDASTGANTTTSPNAFATQLFGDGTVTISPVDRWTLELPIAENPWFTTVSPSDIAGFDGSEFDDAVITLEYAALQPG